MAKSFALELIAGHAPDPGAVRSRSGPAVSAPASTGAGGGLTNGRTNGDQPIFVPSHLRNRLRHSSLSEIHNRASCY